MGDLWPSFELLLLYLVEVLKPTYWCHLVTPTHLIYLCGYDRSCPWFYQLLKIGSVHVWKSDDDSFLLWSQGFRSGLVAGASPGELQPESRHRGHTGGRCSWAVLPHRWSSGGTGLCTVFRPLHSATSKCGLSRSQSTQPPQHFGMKLDSETPKPLARASSPLLPARSFGSQVRAHLSLWKMPLARWNLALLFLSSWILYLRVLCLFSFSYTWFNPLKTAYFLAGVSDIPHFFKDRIFFCSRCLPST